MQKEAQKNKRLKKILGNFLLFNRFINGAKAIQCLSEREKNNIAFKGYKFINTSTASIARCGGRTCPSQIYDTEGIRVIVSTVPEVIRRWALCTGCGFPSRANLIDYIAKPKPNGYQSLHTAVRVGNNKTLAPNTARTK